jgi:hypothetical protein
MVKRTRGIKIAAIAILSMVATPVAAQNIPVKPPIAADGATYSDVADLVTISPLIVDAKVKKITFVPTEQAAGVPAFLQRTVVTADVISLIRGNSGIAAQIRFTLDIPKDSRGKVPNLKKQRFFFMGSAVSGRQDAIRLAQPDALITYSPANDTLVREITRQAVQLDAPQKITGVISAFHSAGTVIGEGETQIFLRTENQQPFSITVSSRPGKTKQWSVSTSELIEESSATPKRGTLLWYRLACGLPRQLPSDLVQSGAGEGTVQAQADYSFVVSALGACGRKR